MVLWIGVDDTDSLRGMCTTFLATELVRDLTEDYDLIGYPRLVRLNPNIPWKTRGNGALCIRIGRGIGRPFAIGEIRGRPVVSYQRGADPLDGGQVEERVARMVERWSDFEDPKTNPGFVVLRRPASASFYWRAVRGIVSREDALAAAAGRGAVHGYKNGRGLIGATAASAWRPRDRTYEVLAYRDPSTWGTERIVDATSVRTMDRAFSSTFNNYDYENGRVVIAPRTPCPILFGIRGDNAADLEGAMRTIRTERSERWLIFETNQGTDDHVIPGPPLEPSTTVCFSATVTQGPQRIAGGHVVFSVDGHDVTVYEPSKQFRDVAGSLAPGDCVRVVGAVRDSPRTVNLEKLQILRLADVTQKRANPLCLRCDKRMKSMGRDAPYRCVRCGARRPRLAEERYSLPRRLHIGWHEPPAGSRRHLSKPVKRMEGLVAVSMSNPERARFRVLESGTAPRRIGPTLRSSP